MLREDLDQDIDENENEDEARQSFDSQGELKQSQQRVPTS